MTPEGYGRGKEISSQQIKALGDEPPLALPPRDSIQGIAGNELTDELARQQLLPGW